MLRVWENPWRLMLAVNIAVLIGVFVYKLQHEPYIPYVHLLVDYHFGFTKRALIGAVVSAFTAKVPVWLVFAISGMVWLITLALFGKLFWRTFGFDRKSLPLFVFMAGSPFFLKNFMHTLGHFDIYGCAVAIGLLLIPARSIWYVLLAAAASMLLILIHHIQFLMYVPTIAAVVLLRHYLERPITRLSAVVGMSALLAIGVLFLAAQFGGTMSVPPAKFVAHLQSRIADTSREDLPRYAHAFGFIWYQPLSQEIRDTWERMPSNLMGVPVFALLIWLHTPLWKYFACLIRSLSDPSHRRIVIAAIAAVSAAYLVMFAIVFDYSRWISNWAVCMFLILFAVKTLPASRETPPISSDDRKITILGAIVTLIPRVGIVRPF